MRGGDVWVGERELFCSSRRRHTRFKCDWSSAVCSSDLSVPPPMVSSRRNLRNLSPTHFSSLVSSALPPLSTFSSLGVDDATESLCSTLSSCLDSLCPLSTRPARSTQSHSWLSDTLGT